LDENIWSSNHWSDPMEYLIWICVVFLLISDFFG
jgi:hypothetical protein